jgi:hypothetical protein
MTALAQFRCAALGAWLTTTTCAARWQAAEDAPRDATRHSHGLGRKPEARIAAGPCDGCPTGAAHARGVDVPGLERRELDVSRVAPSPHAKVALSRAFVIAPPQGTRSAVCVLCGAAYERQARHAQRMYCGAACRDAGKRKRDAERAGRAVAR